VLERLRPRVEDAEVVVAGDEGDEAGDGDGRLVLGGDVPEAQPEEERGAIMAAVPKLVVS